MLSGFDTRERAGAVGTSIGSKGYIIGGHNAAGSMLLNDFGSTIVSLMLGKKW